MKENNIDKIFRERLSELETPVGGEVWQAIESTLDAKSKVPFYVVRVKRAAYYVASMAAILILAFLLWSPGSEEEVVEFEGVVAENREVIEFEDIEVVEAEGMRKSAESVEEPVGKRIEVVVEEVKVENNVSGNAVAVTVENEKREDVTVKDANEKVENVKVESEKREKDAKVESEKVTSDDVVVEQERARDYYFAQEFENESKKGRYTLALASNLISSSSVSVSPQYLRYMSLGSVPAGGINSIEQISETQYSLPINVALQAQVKINKLLSAGVGFSYTLLMSKYEALINKKYYHIKQNLHYLGVPVNLYFSLIDKSNFYLYANIGGTIEKGINASYKLTSYDGITYNDNVDIDGFQYSANLGFGMEYRFIPEVGIYLEPNLVYYFNSEMPASIRTDQPMQVKAEIGFRFHINNK